MSLQALVVAFLNGLKDSLLGFSLLVTIDREKKVKVTSTDSGDEDSRKEERVASRRSTRTNEHNKKVFPMLLQCCFLNGGVFLLSILVFELYFLPMMQYVASLFYKQLLHSDDEHNNLREWLELLLSFIFKSLWVVPLFWLSKLLNSFWFLEIADAAYRKKMGRPVAFLVLASKKESVFKSISKLMADLLFTLHVEVLFLVQAQIVGLVPIIGPMMSFIHLSLLYSLYALEYTWINLGWNVMRRVSCIESNWPYFLGFGLPLTALTSLASSSHVISGCLFGVLFPIFILSGLEAKPVDSGHCVRMFSGVIWITNKVFVKSRTIKVQTRTQDKEN